MDDDIRESTLYGLRLYPFAVLMMFGLFLSTLGTPLFQNALSGMRGTGFYQPVLLLGTLVFQLAGGILSFAGVFGALYKTVKDAKE